MAGIRQYILSVLCCTMICAIIPLFTGGAGKKVLRLVCGIYLTVTVVAPILRIDVEKLLTSTLPAGNMEAVVSEGESMARSSIVSIIKQECEAYILDKANELGLDLAVAVVIGEGEIPIPVSAEIRGEASAQQQKQLTEILAEELGIPEEEQRWIG